jgi:hypothetical protein
MDTAFLAWALADFSGYVAADELSDGPCCLLSAVDKRHSKRSLYDGWEHEPTHDDIRTFLGRLTTALTARALTLVGITTDGSARSPPPLAEILHGVPHHIWTFPVLAEVIQAVLGAGASARKRLAAQQPKWPKGRPSTPAAQAAARQKKRLAQQRVDFYPYRHLVVPRHLSQSARQQWWRLTRGLPQWRALRELMAQVYALFDRRCRTQTALDKWDRLRRRLLRCPPLGETGKKLFAPPLEKALTCLDDKLLPSTSHAVARGNRRYRKRQKQVYRVRPQAQIRARVALEMWREAQAEGRQQTLAALHQARAG